ncbi:oxidoreductase [Pestalotiopsis fici W106-1]|uniref:Oxidoreductase n=1 Tax=Pestalotiopsis fici (strain W106-1 / CGMCC3.15140) TaxID=1229662 RepID=W3X2Q8_PESFW|nr:oxidoreductase [Pestalotiopsis fici W106-1]ETS80345.1 oxidoreductase [Pestalotiopsis fici W106-1]
MSAFAPATGQRLHGKTILITGASSGIGRSTALEFARTCPQGLRLILTARRTEKLNDLAQDIFRETGGNVQVLARDLDVSNPDQVLNFINTLPEEWRDIDILVNNAGLASGVARAPSIPQDDIAVMFSTNVVGLINMTQAVLPIFLNKPNGGRGDIINIGSVAGRDAYPGGGVYCASKAAVRFFSDSLRKELVSTRVRVIEIDPGQVKTEFSVVRFDGDKEKADAVYHGVDPLTPEDVAEVIVFAATRRENVVLADVSIFPSHQASALVMHRKP